MEKKLKNLKDDIKNLRNELIQLFSDVPDFNQDFLDKIIEYSNSNPQFAEIIKLIVFLSSKIDTDQKQLKSKIYKIFEKILNQKEILVEITCEQEKHLKEIKEFIEDLDKNKKQETSFNIIKTFLKNVFTSKVGTIFTLIIIIILILEIIYHFDSEFFKLIYHKIDLFFKAKF